MRREPGVHAARYDHRRHLGWHRAARPPRARWLRRCAACVALALVTGAPALAATPGVLGDEHGPLPFAGTAGRDDDGGAARFPANDPVRQPDLGSPTVGAAAPEDTASGPAGPADAPDHPTSTPTAPGVAVQPSQAEATATPTPTPASPTRHARHCRCDDMPDTANGGPCMESAP